MSTSSNDRSLLRNLAARVNEIARLPEMATRGQRWRRFNALQPERPMVLCFPEGGWSEILPESSLQCLDPFHRKLEWLLKAKIHWWDHIHDDQPLEPYLDLGWEVKIGDFGFEIPMQHGDNRGSYVWEAPMKDLKKDLSRLHCRELSVDRDKSAQNLRRAEELFGDLLPVRRRGGLWWTLGLTQTAAQLVGLENLMWAMVDQPDELHQLMAFLRDDCLHFINWCEAEGVLSPNDGPTDYVGSGGLGCIDGLRDPQSNAPVKLSERWGFAEAQETVGVSPEMFAEFILPYQLPILKKFALNCYGCCEGLEHRIDLLKRDVPGLRRVSVAPMANQEVMAEKLAGKYIFSRKPNPAPVCVGFNEEVIRQDLRKTLQLAGDQPLEFIMKDTHTVERKPERLTQWVKIAYEEIDRYLAGERK